MCALTVSEHQPILLTGGAGFIGSHVAEALLQRGCCLTIIDNLDDFYSPAWKKSNLEAIRLAGSYGFSQLDICDMESLRKIVAQIRPAIIIHLAARAGVRPSIEQPQLYERVNVTGTLNLLELCREFRVKKLVFGSSSSVYGATCPVPFSESQTGLLPVSPYAATKLAGELFCYTYAHLYRLEVICLRFFTVYGPRQRPDLAIHRFTALIEEGKPLPIFGDGSTSRDYTYVDDIVAGVMAALDYTPCAQNDQPPFETFNLGNSHPVKLTDLVACIEAITGRRAICEPKPAQLGDVPATWADISKAARFLGYRPATPLEQGLERFVRWYRTSRPKHRL